MNAKIILLACLALLSARVPASAQSATRPADDVGYSVYHSWSDMDKATDAKYATVTRVSGDKKVTPGSGSLAPNSSTFRTATQLR